ncbi:MAG TPA: macro domain-containing protein [Candidatus Binatia bacterium]|jgi:O-acetyl-ADP-ribose deacetylase (regulator of RNase III)|nr:macro domain-containing protein [Candidatus Binatia bacterium]
MIEESAGNLLEADTEALVNTVNTVGVAGKGIALQFRQAFPENYKAYVAAAKGGEVVPGRMFVFDTGQLTNPRYIINFPTKRHWKGRSRIDDIRAGLRALVGVLAKLQITSVAVPPLGCGNGGLNWSEVKPVIVDALDPIEVRVLLFSPVGAPSADEIFVRTERPRMTLGRAALLLLMHRYREGDSYRLTALEVQKLAYFLQESGEPLRLKYVKARYGPYAENLNHVLQALEGHHIRGYGDRSQEPQLYLLPGAADEASQFLHSYPDTAQRLASVSRLVDEWDTPYGLELLATTHWALTRGPDLQSAEDLYPFVASWTPRKARLFKSHQVRKAVEHLVGQGFVNVPEWMSGAT